MCGLVLSGAGLTAAAVFGSLYLLFAAVMWWRGDPPPADTFATPASQGFTADVSGTVPLTVRLGTIIGLGLTAAGRWWAARVPPRVAGGTAARAAGLVFMAAAGCVVATEAAVGPAAPGGAVPRVPAGVAALPAAAVLLAVFGELVFTWYFTGIGRRLGPGYPRRLAKLLRSRLIFLICVSTVAATARTHLSQTERSDPLAAGLIGLAAVSASLAALVAVLSLYTTLIVHLRSLTEMWQDARGGDN